MPYLKFNENIYDLDQLKTVKMELRSSRDTTSAFSDGKSTPYVRVRLGLGSLGAIELQHAAAYNESQVSELPEKVVDADVLLYTFLAMVQQTQSQQSLLEIETSEDKSHVLFTVRSIQNNGTEVSSKTKTTIKVNIRPHNGTYHALSTVMDPSSSDSPKQNASTGTKHNVSTGRAA